MFKYFESMQNARCQGSSPLSGPKNLPESGTCYIYIACMRRQQAWWQACAGDRHAQAILIYNINAIKHTLFRISDTFFRV
jgi:hypothetical protein